MGGVFVHWGDIDTPVIVRTVVAVDTIEGADNVNAAAAVGSIPVVVAAMIWSVLERLGPRFCFCAPIFLPETWIQSNY